MRGPAIKLAPPWDKPMGGELPRLRAALPRMNASFFARKGDELKSHRQVPTELPIIEFVRRWTLHILPKAFIKTRRFGAFSNKHRSNYKLLCEQMRPTPQELLKERLESSQVNEEPTEIQQELATLECPKCKGIMIQVEHKLRPKLSELFYGENHPD